MTACPKLFYYIGSLAWLLLLGLLLNIAPSSALERQPGAYQERTLIPAERDFGAFGLENCQQTLSLDSARSLAVCRLAKQKSGPRLFLVDVRQTGRKALLFRSSDFGDAYYVKLTVFGKAHGDGPDFVLAESGAEFSYGVQVYAFDGSGLRPIGQIDVVLEREGNASSVIPALRINDTGRDVVFTFTEPVMLPDQKGNYANIPPERLRYVFDGRTLHRSLSGQDSKRRSAPH